MTPDRQACRTPAALAGSCARWSEPTATGSGCRLGLILALLTSVVGLLAPGAASAAPGQVRAGAASVDATWHVGASAGQYASDPQIADGESNPSIDPGAHSTTKAGSYGIQSRLKLRALVVEGPDGTRTAIVKNDLYIPQDLLWRRTAQILEKGDSGITRETLTMAVTHDHSSPYYSSTSPGAWAFQDVFDVRFFNYYAKRMAKAVERAAHELVPVRVGASVSRFDKTARHSFNGAVADDGTPAGYPNSDVDPDLTVVRFDDISNPGRPKPLANLVNFSVHPEFLNGNNLISADYIGPLQRMVDRETKATTIWTTNSVGTSEPERSTYHPISERLEFTHREYAQAEYGARLMADSIVDTWRDVERGTPERAYRDRFVPYRTKFPVAMEDRFFPGPLSHPYPSAQNCRTESAFQGDPRIGTLPTCQGVNSGIGELYEEAGIEDAPEPPQTGVDPGISSDDLKQAGLPGIPDQYSPPSYTALEEDVSVHLQALRLGDILFTICSCEQWKDQARNIKSRTNFRQDDQYLGFDWSKRCERNRNGSWTCPNPLADRTRLDEPRKLPPISDRKFQRMRAQVRNDAAGWNEPDYLPFAESEPRDPDRIKGNYTHTELPRKRGYRLTVPIGQANDYNGYIATYREYQRGDHYRKALTGWGPHSSDYMATRLVQMGGQLKGGPAPPKEVFEDKAVADLAFNDARARALGNLGETSIKSFEAGLPDDGGPATGVKQPEDVRRFSAADFSWTGGSNFTDNPRARVERKVDRRWRAYADQSGELPTTLEFPQGEDTPSFLTGSFDYVWTSHFEAFTSNFDTGNRPRSTPTGRYRFVVDGQRREGGEPRPYHIVSEPFRVRRWDGITVPKIERKRSRLVRFDVGPSRIIEEPRVAEPTRRPPADRGTGDEDGGGATIRPSAQGGGDGEPSGVVKAFIGPIDYPDSYDSPTPFIDEERFVVRDRKAPNDASRFEWFCFACSFRPWADTSKVARAEAVVVRPSGKFARVRAQKRSRSSYVLPVTLGRGGAAVVPRQCIRDENGERNGRPSRVVTRGRVSARIKKRALALAERRSVCGSSARSGREPDRGKYPFTRRRGPNLFRPR